MYYCPKCNVTSEMEMRFCPQCGSPTVEVAAQPTPAPAPTAVAAPPAQPSRGVQLAKRIVGMSLSIGGLVFAAIGNLYTFLFGTIEMGIGEEIGIGLVMAIVFGMFSLPLAIVGLCMSNKSLEAGDTSVMSALGRKLGMAGIIATAASFVYGFFSLIIYM